MSSVPETITSATRRLKPETVAVLQSLEDGQKIEIVQWVRVGGKRWQAPTRGTFRHINYLATGVTTDRVPEDDIVVPMLHFTKENGELSSIAIDENSEVKVLA